MIVVDGETYYNASRAAKFLGVTRFMFYTNVKPRVRAYELAASRNALYKQSELEAFRVVKVVYVA